MKKLFWHIDLDGAVFEDVVSIEEPPPWNDVARLIARQIAETILVRIAGYDEEGTAVEVTVTL